MSKALRNIAVLVIAGGLAAGGYWYWAGGSADSAAVAYQTVAASKGDIRRTVSTSGPVRAVITVQIGSQLSGQVTAIEARQGGRGGRDLGENVRGNGLGRVRARLVGLRMDLDHQPVGAGRQTGPGERQHELRASGSVRAANGVRRPPDVTRHPRDVSPRSHKWK